MVSGWAMCSMIRGLVAETALASRTALMPALNSRALRSQLIGSLAFSRVETISPLVSLPTWTMSGARPSRTLMVVNMPPISMAP